MAHGAWRGLTPTVEPDWHVGQTQGPFLYCPPVCASPLESVVTEVLRHARPGHVGRVGLTPDSASPRAYIHFTNKSYTESMLGVLIPGATRVQCRCQMPNGQTFDFRLLRAKPKAGQDYIAREPSRIIWVRGSLPAASRLLENLARCAG